MRVTKSRVRGKSSTTICYRINKTLLASFFLYRRQSRDRFRICFQVFMRYRINKIDTRNCCLREFLYRIQLNSFINVGSHFVHFLAPIHLIGTSHSYLLIIFLGGEGKFSAARKTGSTRPVAEIQTYKTQRHRCLYV